MIYIIHIKNQEDKIFPLDLWKVKNSTFSEDEGK